MRRRCVAQTAAGFPCGAAPLIDGRYCFNHDPEHAEEAAAARRAGGLRRRREGTLTVAFALESLDSVVGMRRLLDVIVTDALALDGGVARLRVLLSTVAQAVKLHEVGDLEDRMARLEARARVRRHTADEIAGTLLEDVER